MKKLFALLFIAFFGFYNLSLAQDDSTWVDEEEDFSDSWENDWNVDLWDWYAYSSPTIELSYGLGEPKHKKFGSDFSKTGLAEIKLGYTTIDVYEEDFLIELDERYIVFSNIATKLQSEKRDSNLDSDLWRFGFGKKTGYGYAMGFVSLIPYNDNAIIWSRLKMKEYPEQVNDTQILDRYNESFRFGSTTEGGVKLQLGSVLSLNAGYEGAVVFPRHLVWKYLGSAILEEIATGAVDHFIKDVIDESPAAGPIIYALLRNGISFAFYSLRRDDMNWPFATETPLTYETFKFGMTFTF
ncbi:MAG: hypothetical protein V1720_16365 [bacterium]